MDISKLTREEVNRELAMIRKEVLYESSYSYGTGYYCRDGVICAWVPDYCGDWRWAGRLFELRANNECFQGILKDYLKAGMAYTEAISRSCLQIYRWEGTE